MDESTSSVSKSSLLVQALPAESLNKLTQPEHSKTLEVMETVAESAHRQVRSQMQTIDGSLSLEKLAKSLRNTQIVKLRGAAETSILVIYMVEAAGERERDARRSPTPMRRDYMDKVLKAIVSTRGDSTVKVEGSVRVDRFKTIQDPRLKTMTPRTRSILSSSCVISKNRSSCQTLSWKSGVPPA